MTPQHSAPHDLVSRHVEKLLGVQDPRIYREVETAGLVSGGNVYPQPQRGPACTVEALPGLKLEPASLLRSPGNQHALVVPALYTTDTRRSAVGAQGTEKTHEG